MTWQRDRYVKAWLHTIYLSEYTSLHKSTDLSFNHSFRVIVTCLKKSKLWPVVPQLFSQGKQSQTKHLIGNQTICVNQSLVLMLLNSILILCVRICPQACIRDDTTMNKHKKSRQGKIECKTLKIWSRHTFKQPDLKAKLRVSTLHEQRKKLIASVLMVIATIVRLFLKKWVVI